MLASGMWRGSWFGLALLLLAGCGSAPVSELPPPAEAPRSAQSASIDGGRTLARLLPRERALELYDARTRRRTARAPAGVGPTHVACLQRAWCYVTDTQGDALLVFRRTERLELVRRYYLPGGPYGLALDERRRLLYVTLPGRNELVQLPAHGRPHVLRRWRLDRAAHTRPDATSSPAVIASHRAR
jgi:hypothetical protein